MAYMVRWGPKGFLVSPSKVVPFNNFTTSMKLKSDSENDTSGTEPTNTRGRELRPMTFETTYMRALGVDPRTQIDEWEALIGQAHPVYIGAKRFGPPKMMLKEVATSEVKLTVQGEMISCKIGITLEEYAEGKKSQLASTSAKASKSGSSKKKSKKEEKSSFQKSSKKYIDDIWKKRQAMDAAASKSDKAAKKPKR